jgi:hypothetical protein
LSPCPEHDIWCEVGRAGWQALGGLVGFFLGGAGGGVAATAVCGPPVCTVAGAASGAVAGAASGIALAGRGFDNAMQMANAGKGRASNRVPNSEVQRLYRKHHLNEEGQTYAHDQFSKQKLSLEEIESIIQEAASHAKFRTVPPEHDHD